MRFYFPPVTIPPRISKTNWFNWKWQLKNSLKTLTDYKKYFSLTKAEEKSFQLTRFAVQTTPYYAKLASLSPSLRQVVVPSAKENQKGIQSMLDPLGENNHSPYAHVIHRYPDRVVFLITDLCPIYCRYCTRKHFTASRKKIISKIEYQKALLYIKKKRWYSGGDFIRRGSSYFIRYDARKNIKRCALHKAY